MIGDGDMSLKEHDRDRHLASDLSVCRSASFNTVHSTRPHSLNMTTWSTPVLGEQYRSPRAHKKPPNPGYKKSVKLPKVPRPTRTLQVFSSVKDGIRCELIENKLNLAERLNLIFHVDLSGLTG